MSQIFEFSNDTHQDNWRFYISRYCYLNYRVLVDKCSRYHDSYSTLRWFCSVFKAKVISSQWCSCNSNQIYIYCCCYEYSHRTILFERSKSYPVCHCIARVSVDGYNESVFGSLRKPIHGFVDVVCMNPLYYRGTTTYSHQFVAK